MKEAEKRFLYSICEEIMPNITPRKTSEEQKSFALMIRRGESIAPPQISEIRTRTGLSPIFIASPSFGGELDTSRRYARALGANLFLPRCASAVREVLSSCNFSICESEESAILSLSARVPAYVSASCPRCRNFAARLCALENLPSVIIPYIKNRTNLITKLTAGEEDFTQVILELRAIISNL